MNNLEKAKKIATVIDKIFNVAIWILMITNVVVCVIAVLSAFMPDMMDGDNLLIGFQIGGGKFVLADGDTALLYDKLGEKGWLFSIEIILTATIIFSVGIVFLRMLRKILSPMKEGRPFDEATPKYFKIMAVLSLVCEPLVFAIGGIFEAVVTDLISELATSGINIDVVKTGVSMNLGFVFTAAFFLLLSYIFEYGAILQKQSDETL